MTSDPHRDTHDGPEPAVRYLEPDWFSRRVMNPTVGWLARRGVSLLGTTVLEVRGRRSGEWRSTVVNRFEVDGQTYLLAPRGTTHWVRNLRAAGEGRLRLGRRSTPFTAVEVGDADKLPMLREYLRRFGWEVSKLVEGLSADADDDQLLAVAPSFPVFRVTTS